MASIDEIKSTRIQKLEMLRKSGMNPFPSKVPRSFCLADAKAEFVENEKSGKEFSLAGRIMAIRGQGSILFIVLYDGKGKFQTASTKS
jgi:lysyl-tRNA synthetase class 2